MPPIRIVPDVQLPVCAVGDYVCYTPHHFPVKVVRGILTAMILTYHEGACVRASAGLPAEAKLQVARDNA